jgi:recombination protein RecT
MSGTNGGSRYAGGGGQQVQRRQAPEIDKTEIDKAMAEATQRVFAYKARFAQVLPSHINVETWLAIALSSLRRDEKGKLPVAAARHPDDFMVALFRAASMGLEPGTEQYYLTIRKGRIAGVPGYQGEIEMIYRAGAVSSVICQVVHQNDKFSWTPGTLPIHQAEWFGDRGPLVGVYAYAVMKDGAVSNVITLGRKDIQTIRDASDAGDSDYSPWAKWESSMWLKSAAHRLRKWVPTSAEFMSGQTRAVAGAQADVRGRAAIPEEFVGALDEHDPDLALDGRRPAITAGQPQTPPQGVQRPAQAPQQRPAAQPAQQPAPPPQDGYEQPSDDELDPAKTGEWK